MTVVSEKNEAEGLSAPQKTGVRYCIFSLVAVLVLFMIITVTGRPVARIGTVEFTLIYQIVVYVPIFIIASLTLRRLH
jgi:hypothetical protein